MTHVRHLKQFKPRFEYRVAKATPMQVEALDLLLDKVLIATSSPASSVSSVVSSCSPAGSKTQVDSVIEWSPSVKKARPSISSLFHKFGIDGCSEISRDRPDPLPLQKIDIDTLAMKFTMVGTLPSVAREQSSSHRADALATKPPPAKRGGIKRACMEAASSLEACGTPISDDIVSTHLERALKGRIRTTLRVVCRGSSTRQSWAEIAATQSSKHFDLVSLIRASVTDGSIGSKAEAQAMMRRLL